MSAELDALTAQVQQQTTIETSAVALIQGIAQRIQAAGTDGPSLAALTSELKASGDQLAAAVAANTPPATSASDPAANQPAAASS